MKDIVDISPSRHEPLMFAVMLIGVNDRSMTALAQPHQLSLYSAHR